MVIYSVLHTCNMQFSKHPAISSVPGNLLLTFCHLHPTGIILLDLVRKRFMHVDRHTRYLHTIVEHAYACRYVRNYSLFQFKYLKNTDKWYTTNRRHC